MRKIFAAVGVLLGLGLPASAQVIPSIPGAPVVASGAWMGPYTPLVPLKRASNTTAYSGNQIVCGATCSPIVLTVAAQNTGKLTVSRMGLLKSGSSTTNASFSAWFYSQIPTLPSGDQQAYTGPYAADMPYYLGSATCTSPTVTSDATSQVWYECSLSNPNASGTLQWTAGPGSQNIYALISVPASTAYTPASAETFTLYPSGFY